MKKKGDAGYTFHSIRHTFATSCMEEGGDPKTLSEILGHSNIVTTLSFYVHPTLKAKREVMKLITIRSHIFSQKTNESP